MRSGRLKKKTTFSLFLLLAEDNETLVKSWDKDKTAVKGSLQSHMQKMVSFSQLITLSSHILARLLE